MMLYCVFCKNEIIGRFHKRDTAIEYLIQCWVDGYNYLKLKEMTSEEYVSYMEFLIKNS